MKHFTSRNAILREHSLDAKPPNPSSMKQNRSASRKQKSSKENAPPPDLNALPDSSPSPSFTGKPSPSVAGKLKVPLPPRPPSSNPLKRKIRIESHPENGTPGSSDTGVKVIVRIRPPIKNEGGEMIVQKTSGDSLTILGQQFTFDSVADAASTQMDIFQLVGVPLVENCLAGFNGSIFAYGQTGSGKTYTIWGPASTLLEESSSSNEQGLTPRVFDRLFSRINEEQDKHAEKQLVYQCRCSFLEIYNEQITDLLNPLQRNLNLREDTKTGVYVENLTEETISNVKDVTQLLKKGLSNRRTGATSINLESSRSHSVFTCVVESRCKTDDGLSCFKTSRMNLVDLAGSERQRSTGAAGERLKEAGNINRSLSQLGNLINILAEVSQTGKQRHIPYRDSKLTFLLQESLGGNAKLAMVCAISPSQSCRSETLGTLRFAKRAKAIKNKAVANEQMQDNVGTLREVIRQLKDELLRMKTAGSQADPSAGFSTGWNARRSLNILKFGINHPMILPHVDDDGDEEMEIVEEDEQLLLANNEESKKLDQKDSQDTDVNMTESTVPEPFENPCPKPSKQARSDHLAASLNRGLESIDKHQSSALGRSLSRFSYRPTDCKPLFVGKDGLQSNEIREERPVKFMCRNCNCINSPKVKDSNLQLVPVDGPSQLTDESKQLVPKTVEKVLAGAIRREMALEELCRRKDSEISHLNCLLEQYKHERECNLIIGKLREDKIARLERLMDGILSSEEFVADELASLSNENKILKENYENRSEVLRTEIEFKRVQDEVERYHNFFDMGERDVLLEELQDLRSQLKSYTDSSSDPSADPSLESERLCLNETESKSISVTEDLKHELEANRLLVEKQKQELDTEKKCSRELKEAMQMAMEGHAKMLEQYANLEEKYIQLLTTQRRIEDGIADVEKAAAIAGVDGAESKFVHDLATEICVLKAEKEKEKRVMMEENKGLRAQLRDTEEAVQAAGELLVRLKEAEEAVAAAEARAKEAEQEKDEAYERMENSKRKRACELSELPEPFSGYDRCNV